MSSTFVHAFPLESLGSDIARNNFNYEAIFNGLMEWDSSQNDTVTVRLTKSTYPYFHDYTFPTKYASTANPEKEYVQPIAGGSYAYDSRYALVASAASNTAHTDSLTLRVTIRDNGKTSWQPYIEAFVYDGDLDSTDYVVGNIVRVNRSGNENALFIVNKQNASSPFKLSKLISDGYAVPYIRAFDGNMGVWNNNGVLYENDLYIGNTSDVLYLKNTPPSNFNDGSFMKVGSLWKKGESYNKGDYVVVMDEQNNYHTFVNMMEDGTNITNPIDYIGSWRNTSSESVYDENSDADKQWAEVVFSPIFLSKALTKSSVIRFPVITDMSAVVLRNNTENYAALSTSVTMNANVNYKKAESIYNKKVGIYNTSNYLMYPNNTSSIWGSGKMSFDSGLSLGQRQKYSASMIFDHGDASTNTINYINYDGPDLDQGLCIYLPVESVHGDSYSVPEDGFTFEFFFRIWPKPEYNGAVTNDNIINKAHIYVYSVSRVEDAEKVLCSNPIAKFSMARLTNFYVYDENIAIANRPVMYRATFIYSATKSQWEIFDYYQLPDHVFVGPVGFVDPSNVGETASRDGEEYNGLETAGFPLFSDPFDGY